MQVKPGADFLTESRSATNDQSREWKRKEALLLRQFTSVPLRVEWLLQEDNCAWRKSNSMNTKNYICKPHSSLQIGGGDENWHAAGGKAGKCHYQRVTAHTITLLAHLFISFCLCSPVGCLPDELNTLVPWLMKSIWQWLSPCRYLLLLFLGPREDLWLSLAPTLQTILEYLVPNCETRALTHRHEQKCCHGLSCCSPGSWPELGHLCTSLGPVRHCKVGWGDSHSKVLSLN